MYLYNHWGHNKAPQWTCGAHNKWDIHAYMFAVSFALVWFWAIICCFSHLWYCIAGMLLSKRSKHLCIRFSLPSSEIFFFHFAVPLSKHLRMLLAAFGGVLYAINIRQIRLEILVFAFVVSFFNRWLGMEGRRNGNWVYVNVAQMYAIVYFVKWAIEWHFGMHAVYYRNTTQIQMIIHCSIVIRFAVAQAEPQQSFE